MIRQVSRPRERSLLSSSHRIESSMELQSFFANTMVANLGIESRNYVDSATTAISIRIASMRSIHAVERRKVAIRLRSLGRTRH